MFQKLKLLFLDFIGRSRKLHMSLFPLAVIVLACIMSSNTNATSAYDNTITLSEQLSLSNSIYSCGEQNHQTSWSSVFSNSSYWSEAVGTSYSTASSAFADANSNTNGWSVSQATWNVSVNIGNLHWDVGDKAIYITYTADENNYVDFSSRFGFNYAYLHSPNSTPVYTVILGLNDACEMKVAVARTLAGNSPAYLFFDNEMNVAADGTGGNRTVETYFINSPITYPSGYEGIEPPIDNSWADLDEDGLDPDQELLQNTSNTNPDSDSDGLSDFIESEWFPDREVVFCGSQCAYPDPLEKDVYIELDWMYDNSIPETYRPTSTQLSYVQDMFEDQSIKLHVDTGQFGGGNELPTYTELLRYTATSGQTDFTDYKSGGDGITANFSEARSNIWRYMISGYAYHEYPTSSGWAKTMGSDLFISKGHIDSLSGLASIDRAVAGTIAHEIGHTLCLSSVRVYAEQPLLCTYGGIDNNNSSDPLYNLSDYESVMNYRYQLTNVDDLGRVDYSDGTRGADDHDDWGGILLGMKGFSGTRTALGSPLPSNYVKQPDGSIIIQEAPTTELFGQNTSTLGVSTAITASLETAANLSSNPQNNLVSLPSSKEHESDWLTIIGWLGLVSLCTIIPLIVYVKYKQRQT